MQQLLGKPSEGTDLESVESKLNVLGTLYLHLPQEIIAIFLVNETISVTEQYTLSVPHFCFLICVSQNAYKQLYLPTIYVSA